MNITDLDALILTLNREAQEGEMEHHGSATTRFELRSNGEQTTIYFLHLPLWKSWDDNRDDDENTEDGREPIETYLRRESHNFMMQLTATPTTDIPI